MEFAQEKLKCTAVLIYSDVAPDLARKLAIKGTPAILLIRKGKMWTYHYHDGESPKKLIEFAKSGYTKESSINVP